MLTTARREKRKRKHDGLRHNVEVTRAQEQVRAQRADALGRRC
jgi:hypothetical protein